MSWGPKWCKQFFPALLLSKTCSFYQFLLLHTTWVHCRNQNFCCYNPKAVQPNVIPLKIIQTSALYNFCCTRFLVSQRVQTNTHDFVSPRISQIKISVVASHCRNQLYFPSMALWQFQRRISEGVTMCNPYDTIALEFSQACTLVVPLFQQELGEEG